MRSARARERTTRRANIMVMLGNLGRCDCAVNPYYPDECDACAFRVSVAMAALLDHRNIDPDPVEGLAALSFMPGTDAQGVAVSWAMGSPFDGFTRADAVEAHWRDVEQEREWELEGRPT
jgi:hypothetical protein